MTAAWLWSTVFLLRCLPSLLYTTSLAGPQDGTTLPTAIHSLIVLLAVHCLLSDAVVLLHVPHDRDVWAQWCTDTARVVGFDPGRHSWDVTCGSLSGYPWTQKLNAGSGCYAGPYRSLNVTKQGERCIVCRPSIAFAICVPRVVGAGGIVAPVKLGCCTMRQAYASVAYHYMRWCPALGMLPSVDISTSCIGISAIKNVCVDVFPSNTFTFERCCSVELQRVCFTISGRSKRW